MTQVIIGQLQFIVYMLCGGMGIMAGYEIIRLFRWLFPHGKAAGFLGDLLYWCGASIPAFLLFYQFHSGEIRWYGMLALAGGLALYEWGIGRPVRRRLDAIVTPWKRFIIGKFRKCFRKIKKIANKQRKKENTTV